MTTLATITDLQAFMKRTFAGDDLTQAQSALVNVSALARAVAGRVWPAAPADVPQDVQAVVMLATKRLLERLDQEENVQSENMGPFGVTYVDNPDDLFTKGEQQILRRFRTKSGLFTIGSTRGEQSFYDDWWYTDNPYLPEWVDQFHPIPPLPERGQFYYGW
ncbi:hypothetical protein A5747_13365 [Mycobacterium sp. IS-836]|uniref:hypothetical protein n=1 Tax=Mycobacterium sp. IS-836 TaxID=1834160 RepID=UPI00096DC2FB|nr:hypothetical protein [Mycobacterium sp. IS-836]OMC55376.1 hypothetical protein A5747_13365 [Mycobacterium sp. IS-836]